VKDHTALEIAVNAGVDHFALGYAASASAVKELRTVVPADARVLARIDSRAGVERRAEIIAAADVVIVGRHHLAADVPIEQVPFLQKAIAREGAEAGTPVWVATGRTGETSSATAPATVAEASDIANLLLDGVSGLVLTGETAVGSDPFGAIERVTALLRGFEATAGGSVPEASRAG
jgi:pyruvate kinase